MSDDETEYEGEMFSFYEDKDEYQCPTCGDTVCASCAGRSTFNEETANESDASLDDNGPEPSETCSDVHRDTRYNDFSRDTVIQDESSSVDIESEYEDDGENVNPGFEDGVDSDFESPDPNDDARDTEYSETEDESNSVDIESERDNDSEDIDSGAEEDIDSGAEEDIDSGAEESVEDGDRDTWFDNELNSGCNSSPTHYEPTEDDDLLHRARVSDSHWHDLLHRARVSENYWDTEGDETTDDDD